MIEECPPGLAGGGRERAQIEQGVNQGIEPAGAAEGRSRQGVPPVVDQHVEGVKRLDVMPPQRWYEDGIPRCEFGAHRGLQCLAKARKTLEIRKRVLGPNHPQTLSSMYGLACSLCSSGCALEALRLHKEALKIRKIVLPPEHPEIFDSMEGIADSLWSLGEKQEARQLYNDVLSARTTVLGEDHPATLRVAQRVDSASEMMEKSEGDRSTSAETEKESPPNC